MPYILRTRADQDRLLLEIQRKARAFARGVVDEGDVDDMANDIVLYCLEKLRSRKWRKLPRNLQALMRKVVHAKAADIIRGRKVGRSYARDVRCGPEAFKPEWVTPGNDWDEESIGAYQREVMKKLPRRCCAAYELVRLHDFSYEEAAQCMGVSTRLIGTYMVQANRIFRDELRKDGVAVRLPGGNGHSPAAWRKPDDVPFAPSYLTPQPEPAPA